MERSFVVIRTCTDPTGHVDVAVDSVHVGVKNGLTAEERAHRRKDELNDSLRKGAMEVYIVREAGTDGGPID